MIVGIVSGLIMAAYAGFFVLGGVALVYFILKRIRDKREEDFEQRES